MAAKQAFPRYFTIISLQKRAFRLYSWMFLREAHNYLRSFFLMIEFCSALLLRVGGRFFHAFVFIPLRCACGSPGRLKSGLGPNSKRAVVYNIGLCSSCWSPVLVHGLVCIGAIWGSEVTKCRKKQELLLTFFFPCHLRPERKVNFKLACGNATTNLISKGLSCCSPSAVANSTNSCFY